MFNSNMCKWFYVLIFFIAISVNAAELSKIEDVKISSPIFNPSKGEKCAISYNLSERSIVTIKIYDENNYLVRTLVKDKRRKEGVNKEVWDGKDDKGNILPSEAYTFTIEGDGFIYDPVDFSGGERIKNLYASANRKPPYSISYRLPVSARVRIRLGIKGGALYRTLIDWKPKPPGNYTENWDGKDKNGRIEFGSNPLCFISVEAFSLPENSIIIEGISGKSKSDIKRIKREIVLSSRKLYEHAKHPRYRCKDPEIKIILPEKLSYTEDGLPIIKGECSFKVKINEEELEWLKEETPEYIFFVDDEFLFEEENIVSAYIWHFDSTQYTDGKHLLTVNVRSFSDHCATDCVWVYIRNE